MPIYAVIIGIVVAVVVAAVLIVMGMGRLKIRSLILNTKTSTVSNVTQGFVELKGKAVPLQLLKSPISQTDCVCFSVEVQEYRQQYNYGTRGTTGTWVTIAKDVRMQDFLLDDGSGRMALINTPSAQIRFKTDREMQQGMFNELPPGVQNKLSMMGVATKGLIFKKNLRIRETYVQPNDGIYVLGTAVPNNNPSANAAIMITRQQNMPFLVSDSTEEELVKSYFWGSFGFFAAGIVIFLGAAAFGVFAYLRGGL